MSAVLKTHSGAGQLFDEDRYFCKGHYTITVTERRDGRYRISGEFVVDDSERVKPEILNSPGSLKTLHLADGNKFRFWLNNLDPVAGRYELVAAPGNTDEQVDKLAQYS